PGRLLRRDFWPLPNVIEESLVDRGRPLALPQANGRRIVDAPLSGCFSQRLLDGRYARLGELVFVLDAGSQSLHFRGHRPFDVALLGADIDDERMRDAITRQQVGLLLRQRDRLLTKARKGAGVAYVRHVLEIAASGLNRVE